MCFLLSLSLTFVPLQDRFAISLRQVCTFMDVNPKALLNPDEAGDYW